MDIDSKQIARMIDVSDLKTFTTLKNIEKLIETAKKYNFICAFALPCYSALLVDAFKNDDISVGATIGFPTGAETTRIKVKQTEEFLSFGCDELDMVMNIGYLKSKRYDEVAKDIGAVYNAAQGKPLKVIVEAMYLEESELIDACKIVMDSGAKFVKTGTGWAPKPTTFKHIEIMSKAVGDSIKIKAAGGVRDLTTLLKMRELGVRRFGIGVQAGISIMEEAKEKSSLN